jgi:positive regulator of sigma E activity
LAVVLLIVVVLGAYLFVKSFKTKLEGNFHYQPSVSP